MAALAAYDWPGNVRELENLIERAVILADGGVLPNPLAAPQAAAPHRRLHRRLAVALPTRRTLCDSERELILNALEAVGWVVGGSDGAAARLGLNRTTLINMMKRLGIERPVRRRICDDGGLPAPRYAG